MLDIVHSQLERARRTRKEPAEALRQAKERLRAKLNALPDEHEPDAKQGGIVGFKRRSVSGDLIYCVHEATFRSWFNDDQTGIVLREWLTAQDAFERVRSTKGSAGSTSHTLKWPSGKTVRSVIIRRQALIRRNGD